MNYSKEMLQYCIFLTISFQNTACNKVLKHNLITAASVVDDV